MSRSWNAMKVIAATAASFLVVLANGVTTAIAAPPEPDFVVQGPIIHEKKGALELYDLCGLTVAEQGPNMGRLHGSNYYEHSISWFQPGDFETLLGNVDLLDGPCGLQFDTAGRLYVNNYHQSVARYAMTAGPFETPTIIDASHATGVAVFPPTNDVYVNARTHIAVYSPSGTAVMDGDEPLRIGEGSLGDGYGLAVSRYPGTEGHVYVADHADETVKVYDPTIDDDVPVQTIAGPPGGFGSLRDSAIAVDRVSGDVYVVDTLHYPQETEFPQAVVRIFDDAGEYLGRLKYSTLDASPAGLTVDNTAGPTQGRVYLSSGNSIRSGYYVYPPGSATAVGAPGIIHLTITYKGTGNGAVTSKAARISCADSCQEPMLGGSRVTLVANPAEGSEFAGWSGEGCSGSGSCTVEMTDARHVTATFVEKGAEADPPSGEPTASTSDLVGARSIASSSVISQKGKLRVAVSGKLAPRRLPRVGAAPISVSVGGKISTTDRSLPPQLKALRIELNRNGRLDSKGLPRCEYSAIQPGSSSRALSRCRSALVGKGSFTANITLAGQTPYPTRGRLLVFNGRSRGKPVLFGHIYSPKPLATSFVIVFRIQRQRGTYGIALDAPLPKSMDAWGRLTGLEMTLSRRYTYRGKRHSFISAGCPVPKGFGGATFPLARTAFAFEGGSKLHSVLTSTCKVRR